jgi:hypothetical protein
MWNAASKNSIKKDFTVLLSSTTDTCYATTDLQENRDIHLAARPDLFGAASNLLLQHAKHLNDSHMRHAEWRLPADPDPHYVATVGELFKCRRM